MSDQGDVLRRVLAAYGRKLRPAGVEPLGWGRGLSGARLWRVETDAGVFCLRQWPPDGPSPDELAWIHRVLDHVAQSGCLLVPRPRPACSGATWVAEAGRLWELSDWIPGRPLLAERVTAERLAEAARSLGRWHQAAGTFPGPPGDDERFGSPAVRRRVERLDRYLSGGAAQIAVSLRRGDAELLRRRAAVVLEHFHRWASPIRRLLLEAGLHRVPLQPCVGDARPEHFLFDETGRVAGLVDFGSLHRDTVAVDLARLLGEAAWRDERLWAAGLDAYRQVRPLSDAEWRLVGVLARTAPLVAAMNWLWWLAVEGRRLDPPQAALQRLDSLVERLQAASPLEGRPRRRGA